MDIFLLIVIIVMVIIFLLINFYVVVYFQHPDDKNTAYFPKFIVIFGLLFAEASVLLLPLDVANNTGAVGCDAGWNTSCGGINMQILWLIVFMSIASFIIILLPMTIYYYESDTEDILNKNKNTNPLFEAIKLEFGTLLIIGAAVVIMFMLLAQTDIPITNYTQQSNVTNTTGGFHLFNATEPLGLGEMQYTRTVEPEPVSLVMNVSFPIYLTALISFVGWFAFVIFVGIGLISLPLDLILAFVYRPKFIPANIYAEQKLILQKRANELAELGSVIKNNFKESRKDNYSLWEKRKRQRIDRLSLNKLKQSVYLLEKDVQDLRACHLEYKSHNPLIPIIKLIFGCITTFISFLWIVHILLYMLPFEPLNNFLNSYFMWFDKWFPLFGTISVGIFSCYLLLAVTAGCFKFGLRFFFFTLHPMKVNGTYMNSMLFNLGLILLCCIPSVQFSDQAFSVYTRLTEIQNIMGAQIRYLKVFRYFWVYNSFIFAIVGIAGLTILYLIFVPNDRASATDEIRKKIEKEIRLAKQDNTV